MLFSGDKSFFFFSPFIFVVLFSSRSQAAPSGAGVANKEVSVGIICNLEIFMCLGWQAKTAYRFYFFYFFKLRINSVCHLLEFVQLLAAAWMAHSSTDVSTVSLFIRLCRSAPHESKQLFLDLPVISASAPSFFLEAQLYLEFRLFWTGIQVSAWLPNRAPA